MKVIIKSQLLTKKRFAPFGQVVELPEKPADSHKNQRWANVSFPDFQGARPVLDVLYSAPRPLKVERLERHRNSTQTFLPLKKTPFIILVGVKNLRPKNDEVDYKKLQAFISNGEQGITLEAVVWHCSPIPLKHPQVFVLLHRSPDIDLDNQTTGFKKGIILELK